MIAETIDIVAALRGRGPKRRLSELARVAGLDPATGDYRVEPAGSAASFCPSPETRHDPRSRRPHAGVRAGRLCLRFVDAVEPPLNSILESVQGPVAKIISAIIIAAAGLGIAFAASGFFLSILQLLRRSAGANSSSG